LHAVLYGITTGCSNVDEGPQVYVNSQALTLSESTG
jgi:hypothetical protein